MAAKHLAMVAATCAASLAAPSFAQEFRAPMTTFYMAIPLDAKSVKEQAPSFGMQIQGRQPYQTFTVDTRTFKFLPTIAGIEGQWILAGAAGVAAVAALTHKDKGTSQQLQQQQQQQVDNCVPKIC
jgi:hypothetical protein